MKTRILIVDDEPEFTSMMKLSLELEGNCEVREENNALHAMRSAREFEPDLVLMDVMMPEISGVDVAETFHNDALLKNTPVIFLSALVRENGPPPKFAASVPGHPQFLPKPISADALLACIKKATPSPATV